jgi:hypothetical protein
MRQSVLKIIVLTTVLACNVHAWAGDEENFEGPVGEYVRTLKRTYRGPDYSQGVPRRGDRNLQSKSSKASKTPAPTALSEICPPSAFVVAPSKKSKQTNSSRKTGKSQKSCKTPKTAMPTVDVSCPPTAVPTPSPTQASRSKKSSKKSKASSFSCKLNSKSAKAAKTSRRDRE